LGQSATPEILNAALAYAARGWPVFPCNPETKAPLTKRGLKDASTDAATIRNWWVRWPLAMIGLPLGGESGLFALDFDPREEADPESGEITAFTYAQMKAETEAMIGEALPATAASRTPSGGFHVFYRQPEGEPVRNRGNLPRHVDVRGLGGYVIAPPSVRADGKAYAWVAARDPEQCPPVEAPAALVALLRAAKGAGVKQSLTTAPRPSAGDAVRKYALAALEAEARELAGHGQGGRNARLNEAALKMGGLVAAGALSKAMVRAALLEACETNGLVREDGQRACEATFDSGFKEGMANRRDLSTIERKAAERASRRQSSRGGSDWGTQPPPPSVQDAGQEQAAPSQQGGSVQAAGGRARDALLLDRECAGMPRTDLGNAERFLARFGERFRFSSDQGWAVWSGKRWEWFHDGSTPAAVKLCANETARAIAAEADSIRGTNYDEMITDGRGKEHLLSALLARWAVASESKGRLEAIIALVQPMLTVRADAFDTQPLLFNVQNGTLVFEADPDVPGKWRARLKPHDRADYISKIAAVAYEPMAECDAYDAFLEEVQPDAEVRAFLHRWAGLSLTALKIQKLVQHYGTGRNGKGTMIEAQAYVAGDYAGTINIESLLSGHVRSGNGPSPDLAKLPGLRYLRVTEPEDGAQLAESLVKRLTGGDPIDARHNYGAFFTFKPEFKLSFQGNYKLRIRGTDAGIWGRMRLVFWGVEIPEDRQDSELPKKLEAEGSGILNRMVEGLLGYLQGGLAEPTSVTDATAEYRADSDPVGQFRAMCLGSEPGAMVGSRAMHQLFTAWAHWSGNVDRAGRPLSEKALAGKLETAGLKKRKSGSMWWLDVRLLRDVADFLDDQGNPKPQEDGPEPPNSPSGARNWEGWE
jgi:putative DNA primase/helicase